MRALRFWRVGLGAAAVLTAGVALATPDPTLLTCSKTPTAEDVDGAKGAFKAGAQFEERGDYDRAIQYLRDAYNFDCTATKILINLGRVQEKKGDRAGAISTYEAFLQRSPNSPEAATVTEKVKNLKASLQSQAATPQPSANPTVPPPPPSGSATAAVPPSPSGSAEPANPPPSSGNDGKRPYGVVPLVVAGVGGVAAIVGVILMPIGLGQVSTANETCPNHVCPTTNPDGSTLSPSQMNAITQAKNDGNSGRGKAAAGTGLLIGGLVVAGGGLAWQFLGNSPKAAAPTTGDARGHSLSFSPAIGPGITGASLSGRF